MQPRIQEVLDHIANARQELRAAVDAVPSEHRDTKPSADEWCVAEVLEHIALIDSAVAGMLGKKIAEGRDTGLGAETEVSPVVSQRHDAKVRDRTTRIATGEMTRPKASLSAAAAWDAAESSRGVLRQLIIDADGLALANVSAPHRIFGPLNFYEWIAFIGSHESRHAAQIREIGASLDGRAV